MRIACLHVPQFALQCATRLDPSLRGAPVAVVSGAPSEVARPRTGPLHAPIVVACSRAAWALGVRLGMTATAARGLSPALQIVSSEASLERETVRAIADALLGVTGAVDLGGRVGAGGAHLAMYAEVPAKTRGASFGERMLDRLEALGLTGRVGIADDRFTAWVAAAYGTPESAPRERRIDVARGPVSSPDEREVVAVPRGGSAAFLSPRPLSLLAISPEVQHMLEALGVRTLGEFAALPAPSVARPLEADYQALARGESGTSLRPYSPESPIREEVVVSAGNVLEQDGAVSTPAAIALVARRVALRLAGRGRGAARLEVFAVAEGESHEVPVTCDHVLAEAESFARVLAPALDAADASVPRGMGAWRLRVVVTGEALGDGEALDAVPSIYASTAGATADGSAPTLSVARPAASAAGEPTDPSIDTLAVVLSTPGSLFTLSPPDLRAERRDAHRRTRRGKQRRGRPAPLAQSRLFDRSSS